MLPVWPLNTREVEVCICHTYMHTPRSLSQLIFSLSVNSPTFVIMELRWIFNRSANRSIWQWQKQGKKKLKGETDHLFLSPTSFSALTRAVWQTMTQGKNGSIQEFHVYRCSVTSCFWYMTEHWPVSYEKYEVTGSAVLSIIVMSGSTAVTHCAR